nr:myb/SANT-like DNA-binding domain-containing protein 4 [Procambarus clarkii]
MSGIKRKANFSEEELTVLVDEVKKRESIIFGKLSRQVTTHDKHCAWSQVAVAVSGVGLCSRQQADVRKKFQDLKSSVKKKLAENAREMRKTGELNLYASSLKDVAAEVHEGNKSLKEVAKAVDVGNKSFKEVVKEVQDLNKSLNDISKDAYISPQVSDFPYKV